jgi:hypothetical protein
LEGSGSLTGREHFARNPDASNYDWVHFYDLPEATRKALWEHDRHKLVFLPYGLHPDNDPIDPAPQPCTIKYTESVP